MLVADSDRVERPKSALKLPIIEKGEGKELKSSSGRLPPLCSICFHGFSGVKREIKVITM